MLYSLMVYSCLIISLIFDELLIVENCVLSNCKTKPNMEITVFPISLCQVESPPHPPHSSQTAITWVQASTVANISQQQQVSVWFTFSAVDSVHNRWGHHQLSLTLNIFQWCLEIALPRAHFINLTNLLPFHCIITLDNLSQRGRLG